MLKYKCWPAQRTCTTKTKTGIAQIRGIQLLKHKRLPAKLTCTTKPRKKTQNKSANSEHVRFWRRQGLIGIGRNERMHTTVKQPCSSSTMNHATSCETMVRKRNYGTIFKTVQLRKTGQDPKRNSGTSGNAFFPAMQGFFPATHVSKVFGPNTAPIRSRYGPDTAPIRPWYVLDTATGVHFSKKLTAKGWHFFKKSEIYKNWTELSVVKSLGLNCLVICFAFANFTWWKNGWICVKMKKCETKHPEDICCWRNASGKKAAWKQRRGFWGRSSNVSICVCCMSFKQSKTLCGSFLRLFFWVNLHRESMQEKHMWIPADAPAQFTMWTLTGLATHLLQKQNTSHPKILLHNPRENTTT